MKLTHVVESQQFTVPLLRELFDRSRWMERVVARGGTLDYQNKIMATLFYAPSTRTRFSFEAAMHRLGGRVVSTEQAHAFSSEIEGEQVEDSIRIIGSYADVIVIRHHQEGGALRAASVSPRSSSSARSRSRSSRSSTASCLGSAPPGGSRHPISLPHSARASAARSARRPTSVDRPWAPPRPLLVELAQSPLVT